MSAIYKTANKYYNTVLSNGTRLWEKEKLQTLVKMGKLTEKEYEQITGEVYQA